MEHTHARRAELKCQRSTGGQMHNSTDHQHDYTKKETHTRPYGLQIDPKVMSSR